MKLMIEFDLSIYDERAVVKAIIDFQEIAFFRITSKNNEICSVECMKVFCKTNSKKEIMMEFFNYILDLSIAMRNKDSDVTDFPA